jgi:hypothetical protein
VLGLEYVMAGYLHLAAGGDITCQLKKSPEISVTASDTTLKINNTKSKTELNNFDIDTISPYGSNVQSHVGGLMSGELKTTSDMSMMSESYPALNAACLMINKITVRINVDPTIFIAREYKQGSCMYNAIMEHERKHVQVDRMIVNKYIKLISQALDSYYKNIGYIYGPIPIQYMHEGQEKFAAPGNKIILEYAKRMNEERKRLQQNIDSLDEYNRVNNACGGQ